MFSHSLRPTPARKDEHVKLDGSAKVIVIGGHPDDSEYKAGGTALKWARLGTM